MSAIGPFDTLLDAALLDVHQLIDWRCTQNLMRAKQDAEHARRSLGQSFRWITSELTGVMR